MRKKNILLFLGISASIFLSCLNNNSKAIDQEETQSKAIFATESPFVKQQKESLTYQKYMIKYDSLSHTANFHIDSVDNFLALRTTTNESKNLNLPPGLIQSIDKANKYLSTLQEKNIDDYEICRQGIDWLFCCGGNNPPTRLSGYFYPVKYFGYSLVRGAYSARTCGNLAVVHAVFGMKGDALTWIQAGQAHNSECVAAFARNADFALNYAVANHAAAAFAELGIPYLDYAKSGLQILKNLAANYHPDPIPPDEKERPDTHGGHGGKN